MCTQHHSIAAFPSEQFYDGKLEPGLAKQYTASSLSCWPSGGQEPIAFVNVIGTEQTLSVATKEGSERSKSNPQEIDIVVSLFECINASK